MCCISNVALDKPVQRSLVVKLHVNCRWRETQKEQNWQDIYRSRDKSPQNPSLRQQPSSSCQCQGHSAGWTIGRRVWQPHGQRHSSPKFVYGQSGDHPLEHVEKVTIIRRFNQICHKPKIKYKSLIILLY